MSFAVSVGSSAVAGLAGVTAARARAGTCRVQGVLVGMVLAPVLVGAIAGGCRSSGAVAPDVRARPTDRADSTAPASTVTSNILRTDYVGSAACASCHPEVVDVWRRSPMHRMTRLPESTDVRAPFDGHEFHFKDDIARFEQVGANRFVRLHSASTGEHLYRVTKVIGGRYREDFAGLEVASTDTGAATIGDAGTELILPASYVFQTSSFRLKGYSVMVAERPGLRAGGVWNRTCIFCHNTIPYFDDLWGALYGPGAPGYQGEVVDRVLPARARLGYRVNDVAALLPALDAEIAALGGGDGSATRATVSAAGDAGDEGGVRTGLRRAILEARTRFQPSRFVELGVGCEACHGGGREHVEDPRRRPTFEPRAPFLQTARGAPGDAGGSGHGGGAISGAEWQNRTCARCHQVLFSRYARTWEGGSRRLPAEAGGSHITSGEARDFLLGGCARAMACSTCHDPHGEDHRDRLAELATPAGNGVCTGCHRELAGEGATRAHAHHDPRGAGGSCVACHMPRKNMGLGYALTRYHRIGSPTDRARVEGDRPLECALCHADKTVGATLKDIARLWGKHYDEDQLARLYGGLDQNVLLATINRGHAHEQATAMTVAADLAFSAALPAIEQQARANTYPLVRLYAQSAGASLRHEPFHPAPDVPTHATTSSDADDED